MVISERLGNKTCNQCVITIIKLKCMITLCFTFHTCLTLTMKTTHEHTIDKQIAGTLCFS